MCADRLTVKSKVKPQGLYCGHVSWHPFRGACKSRRSAVLSSRDVSTQSEDDSICTIHKKTAGERQLCDKQPVEHWTQSTEEHY